MSLISIIIPCYNAEDYIEECLRSVLNQTYTNLEVIVVNDGSTDKSLSIIQKIAETDPRVRVESHANQGQLVAKNRGISLATGRYFSIVDSDDFIPPGRTQEMVEAFEKNPDLVLVYGDAQVVDSQGSPLRRFFEIYPPKKGDLSVELFANYCFTPLISCLFQREAFLKTGPLWSTGPRGEGLEYVKTIELAQLGETLCLPDSLLGFYRRHDKNITSGDIQKKIAHYEITRMNLEEVLRRHPDLAQKIGTRRIQKRLAFCPFMAGFYAGLENRWDLASIQFQKALALHPSLINRLASLSSLPFLHTLAHPLYRWAGRKLY